MDRLEEIKKKLQCTKCQKYYGEATNYYFFKECTHYMCEPCMDKNPECLYRCPICRNIGRNPQSAYHTDLCFLMEIYKSSVADSAEVENQLRDEVLTFKQEKIVNEATQQELRNKIAKLEKEQEISQKGHHECGECGTKDYEQNMQLCSTCHELKFKGSEDLKKHALCPACAIKKHMRQGHQIVDFYPYLSAYNFKSHSPKIESQSEELKNARDTLNNTLSTFNALSINVSEKYNVLTDMARRSKSTKNQLEFVEKMEVFSNESKSIHVGADCELKERTKMLQESLTKLTNWYNNKLGDCVDESETIKLETSVDSKNNDAA